MSPLHDQPAGFPLLRQVTSRGGKGQVALWRRCSAGGAVPKEIRRVTIGALLLSVSLLLSQAAFFFRDAKESQRGWRPFTDRPLNQGWRMVGCAGRGTSGRASAPGTRRWRRAPRGLPATTRPACTGRTPRRSAWPQRPYRLPARPSARRPPRGAERSARPRRTGGSLRRLTSRAVDAARPRTTPAPIARPLRTGSHSWTSALATCRASCSGHSG